MAVIPVSRDHVIVFSHQGGHADGDGFLADIEMKETGHFTLVVIFEGNPLETANAVHFLQQIHLVFLGQRSVDSRVGVIHRANFGVGWRFSHAGFDKRLGLAG